MSRVVSEGRFTEWSWPSILGAVFARLRRKVWIERIRAQVVRRMANVVTESNIKEVRLGSHEAPKFIGVRCC